MRYKEESGEWLLFNKAALLDPRFSRLVHLSPAQKHLVTESLSPDSLKPRPTLIAHDREKSPLLRWARLTWQRDAGRSSV